MNEEELQEAYECWWASGKNPANIYDEYGQPMTVLTHSVAKAAFEAGIDHVMRPDGKSLGEQFALAILSGDDSALFAAVDKLIEDRVLPEGLKTTIGIVDMPTPGDRYDTKRGVVIVNYVHADSHNAAPQFRVHYHFEDKERNTRRAHYGMTLSRFMSWAKRLPKKSNKEKVK
jgi:hypothetical protein